MRFEEKIAGGKLVCIEISATGGRVVSASITGDFFLHPEERINAMESALIGVQLEESEDSVAVILEHALGDGQLIGASVRDLARIFRRAVS
ncbi:MAG: lipoate protein ligase C-terminal domain-containing protein [Candidatus Micrarchaeota archaeon]